MTHSNIYHDLSKARLEVVDEGNIEGPEAAFKFTLRNYAVTLVEAGKR